jgi:hypothetical protein
MAMKIDNTIDDKCNSFACPACGGREVAEELCISPVLEPALSSDPWTFVLQRIRCADCEEMIPSHLGRRWKGMTLAQARLQWREVFQPALEKRWRGRGWDLFIAPSEAQGQRGRPRLRGQPYVSRRPVEALQELRAAEILVEVAQVGAHPLCPAFQLSTTQLLTSPLHELVHCDKFPHLSRFGRQALWNLIFEPAGYLGIGTCEPDPQPELPSKLLIEPSSRTKRSITNYYGFRGLLSGLQSVL